MTDSNSILDTSSNSTTQTNCTSISPINHTLPITQKETHHTSETLTIHTDPSQIWQGHIIPDKKPPNTFRMMFHNINCIGTKHFINNMATIINEQCTLDIDVQGITKHCINVHHLDTHSRLQSGAKQQITDQKVVLQIDAGTMVTDNVYLPGGTAMIVTGDTVGRLEPKGQGGDPLGRWSYVHLRRKGKPPVTIYTVYQVCKNPTNPIGHTAWHQQRLALNQQNRTQIHPRQAFIDDMIKSIQLHQQLHHDIIIGGDFNETTDKHNSGLLKLLTTTNLVDPFLHCHPTLPTFNTYSRGSTRIDAVFCSPSIVSSIKSIGYAPYNWVTNSDHRAILLDLCANQLFHDARENPPTLSATRAIRSNDKQRATIFIDKFYQHLVSNNYAAQVENLQTDTATEIDVEKLDKLIGQAGDTAEKKCRTRRPEFYSKSLNIQRIKTSIALGHLNNIRFQKKQDTTGFKARLDRAGIIMELPQDQKQAYDLYTSLKNSLRDKEKMSSELREQQLQAAISERVPAGTINHARKLKAIKKKEAAKKAWRTLKFLKAQSGATQTLNRIDIPMSWPTPNETSPPYADLEDPKKCKNWRNISNPDEIEHYVRLRNRGHFGQAQGTPFTELPLEHHVNWTADTPTCDDILNGHHQIDTIDAIPQCQALLDSCKAATDLDLLPYEITEKEFEGKIRSWSESTTTSPSGRHLGRYKVLYTNIPQTDSEIPEDDVSLKTKQLAIARSIISVINYCLRTGHVLERWKTIINTMIFKETGNYQIHRLRVIHIYEADFNLLLAVKWRQLLQSSDLLGLINDGLFGGRPGCEAQSLTFLEELKYDISFMTQRTLFNFDNDATSCYDRIIVALASLINRKYGLHRKVVAVHANTLLQARFHLRTTSGISDQFYSHSIQFPVYGSGQGSGNSPGIWLFISSTLCDVHNNISTGATFYNPDGTEQVSISMVGFVDDSTGTYNDFQPQHELPFETMMSYMQTDAQAWNDLLWCSGGKLELPKCSYHVLRFTFAPNGTPSPDLALPTIPLEIKDSETGQLIPIPAKQANDPHKTLGHWKAPCEKHNKTQLTALKDKAKKTTMLIATGAFSRYGTQLAYAGVYLSSLKYVLPQCYFDHKHLTAAETKTASIILSKLGFNRHTPLAIRYTPKTFAGCGMIPWWVLQSEGQVSLFLKHWRTDTTISKTVRIATAWCQWQSGLSESFLINTDTKLPHVEARWLKSLRNGLAKASMKIRLHQAYIVPPERHNDIYIMQWAAMLGKFCDKHLKVLNSCRTYLHVTTISELFNINNDRILPYMYNCERPPWFNTKQFMSLQPRPSSYQIRKIWKPFCDQWKAKILHQTHNFGATTGMAPHSRPHRQTYCDTTLPARHIYHWINGTYWKMKCTVDTNGNTLPLQLRTDKPTTWKPTRLAHPIGISIVRYAPTVTIYQLHPNTTQIFERLDMNTIPEAHPPMEPAPIDGVAMIPNPNLISQTPIFRARHPSPAFQEHMSTFDKWESDLLEHIKFAHDMTHVIHKIRDYDAPQFTLIAIIDHCFHDNNACYGWMLCLPNGHALAECHGPNLGPPSGPRATAWGILSVTTFLNRLLSYANQPHTFLPPVTILSRNSKITTYLRNRPLYPTLFCNATLANHWDILEQTHMSIKRSQVRIHWETVPDYRIRHHQTTPTPFSLEQTIMDTREVTRNYIRHHKDRHPFSPFLPDSRCMVFTDTSTIHANYNLCFREAATLPNLKIYLQNKHEWSCESTSQIRWDWLQQAIRTYKAATPNHLTKLIYNQLATPSHKAKAGGQHWHDPICPHCHLLPETFDHILRCGDPDAIAFRTTLLKNITSHCEKHYVPTEFHTMLKENMEAWLDQKPSLVRPEWSQPIQHLIAAQNNIGWNNFTRGFLNNGWASALESTILQGQTMKGSPSAFFTKLIVILWNAQTTFWTAYQDRRHNPPSTHTEESEKTTEIKEEISHLFTLRDQVLPAHQQTYFPQDIHVFLNHSTHSQLQSYVHNYSKAIRLSIKQHKAQSIANTRTLLTYQGFERTNLAPTILIAHHHPQPIAPATPVEAPIPIILPMNIPPPAPNENPTAHPIPGIPIQPQNPARRQVQQSILATFRRRRTIREITPPPPQATHEFPPTIHIPAPSSTRHRTVGDYINQMIHHTPSPTNTQTSDPEENNPPPVTATRASSSYKHSKWRPAAIVREKFSQYFRK